MGSQPEPTSLQKSLPNTLTMMRLVFAGAFFATLNLWWYDKNNAHYSGPLFANIATGLFVLAAITDALDGYLARLWHVESVFGRIMDPVCDKVLVIGAFVYLAGPRFLMPEQAAQGEAFAMASGFYPWMAVVMIFRELLITGIRSVAEAQGVSFPSNWWGKAKMILQSAVIPVVICIAANFDPSEERFFALRVARDVLVWATLVVTLVSGVPYVTRCVQVFRSESGGESD